MAVRIRARDRLKFLLISILFRYRRRMNKFGSDGPKRWHRQVRNYYTCFASITERPIKSMAAK